MSKPDVVVNEDLSRFELEDEGQTAFMTFTRTGKAVVLVHTEVPEALEGRGVGTSLVRAALEYVRNNDLALIPRCPFVSAYLKRNPDETAAFGIDPSML